MSAPVCYSKRLLNPFSGVIQVMEADNSRAISTDGINWRIQILSEIFKMPWHELEGSTRNEQYFVYGIWSKTGELRKAPIHPTLYQEHVEQSAEDLIQLLSKHHDSIPFPPMDSYECWLLDGQDHKPLVLLNSRIDDQLPDFPRHPDWMSCDNRDHSFTSSAFQTRRSNATITLHAKDVLRDVVKKQTGPQAQAIWVKRDKYGHGYLLKHNQKQSPVPDEVISAETFPMLGIRRDFDSQQEQKLINDYIQWLSPRLLTLPGINNHTRTQLEIAAQQHPLEVEKVYRLYPEVMDQSLLNKILVEAALRRNTSDSI